MTPEGKIKDAVKKMLKKYAPKVWYFMPVSLGMGKHGIPDIIICCKGEFLAVETKAPDKDPTALQHRCMTEILEAEGNVWVVNSMDRLTHLEEYIKDIVVSLVRTK